MHTLDLETKSTFGSFADGYALEPWRARAGTAHITSISTYENEHSHHHIENPTRDDLIRVLDSLAGQEVWAHNGPFDIAWLIASIQPNKFGDIPECVKRIRWRDSMLLAKWIINSQKADLSFYKYNLAALCGDALRDDPDVQEFIEFKTAGTISADSKYWSLRGKLDVLWTHKLVSKIYPRLQDSQRTGFFIESKCLVPVANSWLIGLKANKEKLKQLEIDLAAEDEANQKKLPFNIAIVTSPKRLSEYLFGTMGFSPVKMTPSGAPSTDEESLKTIEYQLKLAGDPRSHVMSQVMDVKYNSTIRSKYVNTAFKALERTGDGYLYPIPKMFGTSSGRFTYSNETTKGVKVSIAAHQMPRKEKRVREAIEAPDNMFISEWDAAGQESRIMALQSQDPVMIDIFQNGKNFHSMTGCNIVGIAYEEFQRRLHEEDGSGEVTEYRQMGKLTNLSCNFRISGPALSNQAFRKYDMVIGIQTGNMLVNTFKNTYVGVPRYWRSAIEFSRSSSYAATSADRRYGITDWSRSWPAEQSAISHPIQGTGAEHKLIAIATVYDKVPRAQFMLDLHDAMFFIAPDEETHNQIGEVLNSIKYGDLWSNLMVNIPLPFEGKFGRSFKDVK